MQDTTESTVAAQVNAKLTSLKSLQKRMEEMHRYLSDVVQGKMPVNHQIIYNMQDMFNLSPNLKVEELVKAFASNTNDSMLVIYLSSLIRSIIALHNLINNKMMNIEAERKANEPPKTEEDLKREKEEREKALKEKEEKEKAEKEKAQQKTKRPKKDVKKK